MIPNNSIRGVPRLRILAFAILCTLLFAACAKKPVVRPTEVEPYAGPVNIDVLKQQIGFRNLSSVKALAEVRLFRKGDSEGSFHGVFGYRAPQSMRISLFGPFGLTVMDFLVSEHELQLHLPPKNMVYEWESPELPLLTLLNERFNYTLQEDGRDYVLHAAPADSRDEGITTRYLFDRTYLRNTAAVFYRNGLEFARADFDAFNGKVPEKILISFQNRTRIEIYLTETEFDTTIPDEYFRPVDLDGKKVRSIQDLLRRLDPNR